MRTAISVTLLGLVLGVVGYYYQIGDVLGGLQKLSPLTLCVILIGLLANAFAAALRFEVVAAEIGHPTSFRRAMAAVGAGSLAGAAFFQMAGQLMARGVIARRGGMPFAAVVVVTAYERIVAAVISGLLALAGALFIFGKVYLDQDAGGAELIKIACGLIAAVTAGALFGYGPVAVRSIAPLLTRHFVRSFLRVVGLTFLVQFPMMAAYVAGAHALSPQTPLADLAAAAAIVMFAASIPISLAGWGVREMSAVVALGAIGVAASDAFTAAIVIGAGSMLSMGIIATISLPGLTGATPKPQSQTAPPIDYFRALAWILPITAAVFVLFQIYIPIRSGLLNVNLADPIAILAAALYAMHHVARRHLPRWRVSSVNAAIVVMTLALGGALLIGAHRFGWTDWALINRFVGWFILLAFAATGALIVTEGGRAALRTILLTYVGAAAAVVSVELILVLVHSLGFRLPPRLIQLGNGIEGFAQNHNFLAFQLLMALAAALVFVRGNFLRLCLWTVLLLGFWFAGSRSGWIAAACVFGAGIYLRVATIREVVTAIAAAAVAGLAVAALPSVLSYAIEPLHIPSAIPGITPTSASTQERLVSIVGGWKLFVEYPIFGAGLGAFRNEMILATSGIPLLIHSTALWLLAELGLVGFLVFAVPAIHVWMTEWRRAPYDQAAAVVALCFLAFAVMSGPADMVYQRTFWFVIGAALALPRPTQEHEASSH